MTEEIEAGYAQAVRRHEAERKVKTLYEQGLLTPERLATIWDRDADRIAFIASDHGDEEMRRIAAEALALIVDGR